MTLTHAVQDPNTPIVLPPWPQWIPAGIGISVGFSIVWFLSLIMSGLLVCFLLVIAALARINWATW